MAGLDDSTGLNFAIAAGGNTDDGRYGYIKLGLTRQFFRIGSSAISLDYYASSDPQPLAVGASSWGLAVTQDLNAAKAQLFATYRRHDIDGSGLAIQGAELAAAGFRVSW